MAKILCESVDKVDNLPVRLYESFSAEDGVIYIVDFYTGNPADKVRYNWIVSYRGVSLESARQWFNLLTGVYPSTI